MTDFLSLLKTTPAYKIAVSDKSANRLNHAYLILHPDSENLGEYLKIFASIIACKEVEPCLKCRSCRLIAEEKSVDTLIYPKDKDTVLTDDINSLTEECYIKPIESDKKIFIINHGETMTAQAQNKLLKTLEEPPKNVYILIGATSEYGFLPTVLSRVNKLEIPQFSEDTLFSALKDDYIEHEKLKSAISCGDGTVGKAISLYGDEKTFLLMEFVSEMLTKMQSSKNVLEYSKKLTDLKVEFLDFLDVLERAFADMLLGFSGREDLVKNKTLYEKIKGAEGYKTGSIIYALEKITEAQKRKKFNANANMLIEWLLMQILEGRYKWQKL